MYKATQQEEKSTIKKIKESQAHQLPLLGGPEMHEANSHSICAEDEIPTHACYIRLCEALGAQFS